MRRIRFRGKDARTGGWCFGYHIVHKMPDPSDKGQPTQGFQEVHYIFEDGLRHDLEYEVLCTTIGQLTGLTDFKNRDIYEGDIVHVSFQDGSGSDILIGWNGEMAGFGCMDGHEYRSIGEGYDFARFDVLRLRTFRQKSIVFEVVGNIHDDPKLMEV